MRESIKRHSMSKQPAWERAVERRRQLLTWLRERPEHEGLTTAEIVNVSGVYAHVEPHQDGWSDPRPRAARDLLVLRKEGLVQSQGSPARWALVRVNAEGGLRMRSAKHAMAELVGCRYCLAGPGHPCVNQVTGNTYLKHPHPERLRDAKREMRLNGEGK